MPLPDVGQYLFLNVPEGSYRGTYDSRLQEIKKDSLIIDIPMNIQTRALRIFPEGTRMIVTYTDFDDRIPYSFETQVQAVRPDQMMIKNPQKILRNQRRDYVRVPTSLPVRILTVDMSTQNRAMIDGTTENLSGGGMLVLVDERDLIQSGNFVGLEFQMQCEDQTFRVSTKALVIRVQASSMHSRKKICAMKFTELAEQDRQHIIQFVFRRQIEIRGLVRGN